MTTAPTSVQVETAHEQRRRIALGGLLGGLATVSGIALTAIPLSFLASGLVLHILGLGINTMTLGGLAIAAGELVDDAIVDVENVFRRLREARARGTASFAALLKVVYEASVEVRSSIVLATAIVVLAFVPLLALDGIEGRLFQPLGIAYISSILCIFYESRLGCKKNQDSLQKEIISEKKIDQSHHRSDLLHNKMHLSKVIPGRLIR